MTRFTSASSRKKNIRATIY